MRQWIRPPYRDMATTLRTDVSENQKAWTT